MPKNQETADCSLALHDAGIAHQAAPTADTYLSASLAEGTRRVYENDLKHFLAEGGSIPCSAEQLVDYLVQAIRELAVSTLQRRLIAIHKAHVDRGLPSPMKDPLVRKTMQGIRRVHGTGQRRVQALVSADILQMLVMVEQQKPLKAARDKALLLIGFAGAFRRSELVGIRCEDIAEFENGIEVFLPRSKTDQEQAGRTVWIPCASGRQCPVKALKSWLAVSGITNGPVFRAVSEHGAIADRALTSHSVARIVKAAAARIGRDPAQVSGHSLRAGYVTAAAMRGLQPYQIREQTGHRSDATLARYIRPVAKRMIPSLL